VISQAAKRSTLSFTAPPSATHSATKHDGSLRLLAVTGLEKPIHGDDNLKRNHTKVTAPSPSLNPTQTLTHEGHPLKTCLHGGLEYPHCHLLCNSLSHSPQISNCAHSGCWPSLGSTAHPRRRISEVQPHLIKALLFHRCCFPPRCRRTKSVWRSCAIMGS